MYNPLINYDMRTSINSSIKQAQKENEENLTNFEVKLQLQKDRIKRSNLSI